MGDLISLAWTLKEKFESPSPSNPDGRSDLPGMDVFISTADVEKEPPLTIANAMLSILTTEYPVEKLALYISDDGGLCLPLRRWLRLHRLQRSGCPSVGSIILSPEILTIIFSLKGDPTKNKKRPDFVKDRRRIKREYDEFKVRINGLPKKKSRRDVVRSTNASKNKRKSSSKKRANPSTYSIKLATATWMADGTHWPGTWYQSAPDHAKGDHAGIIQVMIKTLSHEPVYGNSGYHPFMNITGIETRILMFIYMRVSRETPWRFEGIDPSDRYVNHNTVFFDGNMRALNGLQGPMYVGTGCLFRRYALYDFNPPRANDYYGAIGQIKVLGQPIPVLAPVNGEDSEEDGSEANERDVHPDLITPMKFGNSSMFLNSIPVAEFQGRPLADHPSVNHGRPPSSLLAPRPPLDAPTVAEAVSVISCW
ncbi:uncharacterized protein A4U43_C01F13450 [Asparagus officinalis]|uniref:Uncharacterized protein n=1 Tax=Asparagus officinalis TaxID=4686 RepID=A0A5P1FP29_ASPOF|nr:uncharacterized protein A4U43_C01F13450 [Asparagus officinalis]